MSVDRGRLVKPRGWLAVAIAVTPWILPAVAVAAQVLPASLPSDGAPDVATQWGDVIHAATRLPLAAALASILALRFRRRGTPERNVAVIHTQIIIAVVGALVMLVVGSSLARAFGIVGAAGLVRYRAKIDDPKDAGVMLSTLSVGLATGVGLWMIAIFGTVFLLALLWAVESFEPPAILMMTVKVKAKDAQAVKPGIERLLRDRGATFSVLAISSEELDYQVRWPADRSADRLSDRLSELAPSGELQVEVDFKKK